MSYFREALSWRLVVVSSTLGLVLGLAWFAFSSPAPAVTAPAPAAPVAQRPGCVPPEVRSGTFTLKPGEQLVLRGGYCPDAGAAP